MPTLQLSDVPERYRPYFRSEEVRKAEVFARFKEVVAKDEEAKAAAATVAPPISTAGDPTKATASAAVTAQAVELPASTAVTDTYKAGFVQNENVRSATGAVRVARASIESVNFGVSVYNDAKHSLANETERSRIQKVWGDEGVAKWTKAHEMGIEAGLRFMKSGTGGLNQYFQVSGPIVEKTSDGFYKVNSYTVSAQESGWSVSIKYTGEAKAMANGIDVTDQISDKSSTGFKWSEAIAKAKAKEEAASAVQAQSQTQSQTQGQTQAPTDAEVAHSTLTQGQKDYRLALFNIQDDTPSVKVAA